MRARFLLVVLLTATVVLLYRDTMSHLLQRIKDKGRETLHKLDGGAAETQGTPQHTFGPPPPPQSMPAMAPPPGAPTGKLHVG